MKTLVFAAMAALASAQTYTLISSDTFTRANSSAGSPGNSWTDVTGTVWFINSNTMDHTNVASLGVNNLVRPTGENFTDGKVAAYAAGTGTGTYICILRYQNDSNFYFAYEYVGTQLVIGKVVAGVQGTISSTSISAPPTGFRLEFSAIGTTLTLNVVNSGGTVVSTTSGTDSSLTAAGRWGIEAYGAGGTNQQYSRVDGFSASSSALTAGSLTLGTQTTTTANLSSTAATGGTPTYTYQWYRSTTNGFTPGSGNIISGATSLSLADTGLTAGTTYYYVVKATDSASATALSSQLTVTQPTTNPQTYCFIGDSITYGYGSTSDPVTQFSLIVRKIFGSGTTVSVVNRGITGTTSADWATSTYYSPALAACASANVLMIMLGTNDSRTAIATSQSAYQTNIQTLITQAKIAGITRIFVNVSPYINTSSGGWDITTSNALLVQYQSAITALANADPGHVWVGDTQAYTWFQSNPSEMGGDGVHPILAGDVSLGFLWAQAWRKVAFRDITSYAFSF